MDYTKSDLMTPKEMMDELVDLRAKLAAAEEKRKQAVEELETIFKHVHGDFEGTCDTVIMAFAALERERDAERAHNAVLRGALEKTMQFASGKPAETEQLELQEAGSLLIEIKKALNQTPSESAAKVQKLIDALESILNDGWCDETLAKKTARQALAEWRA